MRKVLKLKKALLAGFIVTVILSVPQSAYSITFYSWGDNNDGNSQPGSFGISTDSENPATSPSCITNCGGNFDGTLEYPPISGGPDYATTESTRGTVYPYYKVDYDVHPEFFFNVPNASEEVGLSYVPDPDEDFPPATYSLSEGTVMRFAVPIADQSEFDNGDSATKITTTFSAAPGFSLIPLYVGINSNDPYSTNYYVAMFAVATEAVELSPNVQVPVFYLESNLDQTFYFSPELNYDGAYVQWLLRTQSLLYQGNPPDTPIIQTDGITVGNSVTLFDDSYSGLGGGAIPGSSSGGGIPLAAFGVNSDNSSFNNPSSSAVPELPQGAMAVLAFLLAGLVIYLRKRFAW